MNKTASAAVALALVGTMAIPSAASAASASFNIQYGQQDRYVGNYCYKNPNWRGCDDWRDNHHRWSKSDYQRWYRWHQPSIGNVAAGLFGFAVGAAIINGINNSSNDRGYNSHVAACEARYKSYNAETDMYLGYDGDYHRCRL